MSLHTAPSQLSRVNFGLCVPCPDADKIASLLLCAPSAGYVTWSVIDGHVVVDGGRLVGVDLVQLCADAARLGKQLTAGVSETSLGRR